MPSSVRNWISRIDAEANRGPSQAVEIGIAHLDPLVFLPQWRKVNKEHAQVVANSNARIRGDLVQLNTQLPRNHIRDRQQHSLFISALPEPPDQPTAAWRAAVSSAARRPDITAPSASGEAPGSVRGLV